MMEVKEKRRKRTGRPQGSLLILLMCIMSVAVMFAVILQDDSVQTVIYQMEEEDNVDYFNHTLYVTSKDKLYMLHLSDGKASEVGALPVYQTIAYDYDNQMFYYTFGNSLYQCAFNQGEVEMLYTCKKADALHCISMQGGYVYLMALSMNEEGIQVPKQLLLFQISTHAVLTTDLNASFIDQILCQEDKCLVYTSSEPAYGGICTYNINTRKNMVLVSGKEGQEITSIKNCEIIKNTLYYLTDEEKLFLVSMDGLQEPEQILPQNPEELIKNFCFTKERCFLLTHQPEDKQCNVYEYDPFKQTYHKFQFVFPNLQTGEKELFFYEDSKLYYKELADTLYSVKLPLAYE